jgi:hypothetical protein
MPNESMEIQLSEKLSAKLEEMCKFGAIAKFTSDAESATDYDKLMEGEDHDLLIWAPFENYDYDDLAELVEGEFDTLMAFSRQVVALTAGAGDIKPPAKPTRKRPQAAKP